MQEASHKSARNLHHVQIIETEASIGCGLKPSTVYELAVELSQIVLQQDNKILFVWPFKHVRRYGYTSNSFSIEAGSKSATGEGLFIFRCHEAIQLYNQAIASVAKIKQLKSRQLAQRSQQCSNLPAVTINLPPRNQRYSHELGLFVPDNSCRSSNIMNSTLPTPIPHYVRNNCEYAQVMKRSSNPVCDNPPPLVQCNSGPLLHNPYDDLQSKPWTPRPNSVRSMLQINCPIQIDKHVLNHDD